MASEITDEFTVEISPLLYIRPEDEELSWSTNDPKVEIPTIQYTTGSYCIEGPDVFHRLMWIHGQSLECISLSHIDRVCEFELFTMLKGLDPKNESDDGLVSWGRSTNGEMWFTDDARCVNREYVDGIRERAVANGRHTGNVWLDAVPNMRWANTFVKFVGAKDYRCVTLAARCRTLIKPVNCVLDDFAEWRSERRGETSSD